LLPVPDSATALKQRAFSTVATCRKFHERLLNARDDHVAAFLLGFANAQ
jgi:hypothetical protein